LKRNAKTTAFAHIYDGRSSERNARPHLKSCAKRAVEM
jgi:hypothetical protein